MKNMQCNVSNVSSTNLSKSNIDWTVKNAYSRAVTWKGKKKIKRRKT